MDSETQQGPASDRPGRNVPLRLAWTLPVGALAFWLAFRGVQGDELKGVLRDLRWGPLLGAWVAMGLQIAARTGRFVVLVRAWSPVAAAPVARIGAIGFMAIDLLPARLGELVRPALLKRDLDVPVGAGIACIALERLHDLAALLAILLGVLAWAELPSLTIEVLGRPVDLAVEGRNVLLATVGIVLVPALLLGLAGQRGAEIARSLGRFLPGRLGELVAGLMASATDAIRAVARPRTAAATLGLSALVWSLNLLITWLLLLAVGAGLGAGEAGVVMIVVSLALMLPSPAGGLGVFELGAVAGARLYAVGAAPSAAFAVALQGTHVGVITLVGLAVLGAQGVRFGDLWTAGRGR